MGKGAMGLFGTNMADFQLGLAMDDKAGGYLETDEEIAQVRTRRPVVWRRLHAVDARRLRESMWLRPFGPRRGTTILCLHDHTRVHASRE